MRISDWSSDVCSSDLERVKLPTFNCPASQPVERCAMVTSSLSPERAETITPHPRDTAASSAAFASVTVPTWFTLMSAALQTAASPARSTRSALVTSTSSPMICTRSPRADVTRSEEQTSELQSLMRTSYAVFCLKKKTKQHTTRHK